MTFGSTLASIRRRRGWSQETLAFRAGLSQRHVSFLETGRSRPGADGLRKLANALALRGWEHRALLEALAPMPSTVPAITADPSLITDLIDRLSPWPAYAFHSDGTLVATNGALDALLARASPDIDLWQTTAPAGGPNIFDLIFHPGGLVQWMANPEEVVPETLRRLHVEAAHDITLMPALKRMQAYPSAMRWGLTDDPPPAVLFERYVIGSDTLSIISVLSHLASPGELLLDRLRIESFVPADANSENLLKSMV